MLIRILEACNSRDKKSTNTDSSYNESSYTVKVATVKVKVDTRECSCSVNDRALYVLTRVLDFK